MSRIKVYAALLVALLSVTPAYSQGVVNKPDGRFATYYSAESGFVPIGATVVEAIGWIPVGFAVHLADTVVNLSTTPSGAGSAGIALPATARHALIYTSGQIVRVREDGTNPTTAIGYPMADGETLVIANSPTWLSSIRFIGVAAGGFVTVRYFK